MLNIGIPHGCYISSLGAFLMAVFTLFDLLARTQQSTTDPNSQVAIEAPYLPHRRMQIERPRYSEDTMQTRKPQDILKSIENSNGLIVLQIAGKWCAFRWQSEDFQTNTAHNANGAIAPLHSSGEAIKRSVHRASTSETQRTKAHNKTTPILFQLEIQIQICNCSDICVNKAVIQQILIQQQQIEHVDSASRIRVEDMDVMFHAPDQGVDRVAIHQTAVGWCCDTAKTGHACAYRLALLKTHTGVSFVHVTVIPEMTKQTQVRPGFGPGTLHQTISAEQANVSTNNLEDALKPDQLGNSTTLQRMKRQSGLPVTDIDRFSQSDYRQMQPKNLQIVPFQFGSFNVSWEMTSKAQQWISHYELVFLNLGEIPSNEEQARCSSLLRAHNLTDGTTLADSATIHDRQLSVNVTAPASSTIISGLPPDNFYRVVLFAMLGSQRSPPASMPSSPRVPSLPPLTPPTEVKVSPLGTQTAKVSWKPPLDADCTGELINFVISINSTRLIEPMSIKVAREARSHVVEDLIPGTYYALQVAAATRGGVGVPSLPVHFRTGGELPQVELDDLDDVELPLLPEEIEELTSVNRQFYEGGFSRSHWVTTNQEILHPEEVYMIPAKIHNLRATPSHTSIHLKWSVALRRIEPEAEDEMFASLDANTPIEKTSPDMNRPLRVQLAGLQHPAAFLPPGTKYIIRWGDMHPGPEEDTVMGDQTEYIIENLRPGTIYYIRVIAVTQLGDGPAAYTVTMTRSATSADQTGSSSGPIIPVNLVVRAVGSTWARVGWELPQLPPRLQSQMLQFKIKYYPINLDRSISHSFQPGASATEAKILMVNLSVPIGSTTPGDQQQSWPFKAVLRGLQPATQYEFGVCFEDASNEGISFHEYKTSPPKAPELCWSMVQGFETFGKNPSDAPDRIRITVLRERYDSKTTSFDDEQSQAITRKPQSVDVRLHWNAPSQPNGDIVAYVIYLSADRAKSVNDWTEHIIPGNLNFSNLSELQSEQIYFLRMVARNKHGTSPFSPVIVFRTPDTNGRGGGMVRLSKTYYDAREILEPLDNVIPAAVEDKQASAVHSPRNTFGEFNGNDQLRWIIIGSVLGGTVVIVLVASAVLFNRCRKARNSLGIMKKSASKQPYMPGYPNVYRSDPTNATDMSSKAASFSLPDPCLGSFSLAGSGTGGLNAGGHLAGCTLSDNSIVDPRVPGHDCSGHNTPGIHHPCLDWSASNRMHAIKCHGAEHKCSCGAISDTNGPTWTQPTGINSGYLDDRHSTPAGSDIEAPASCSGSARRFEINIARKQSKRNDGTDCCNHGYHRQGGYVEHTASCRNHLAWNHAVTEGITREMTTSFVSSTKHRPGLDFNSDAFNGDRGDLIQSNNAYRPLANNRCLRNGYRSEMEQQSPEMCFIQPRHIAPTMVAFRGSGSLNDDEAIASSPASSSAGHASAGLPHWSPMRKYQPLGQHPCPPVFYAQEKLESISPQRIRGSHGQTHLDGKGRRQVETNKFGRKVYASNGTNRENYGIQMTANRVNAMSSDYASQQSSLSNPSSASSAIGNGLSPERPSVNTSLSGDNRVTDIGLSFALDRVPTPEPTPRPAPFSRLAVGKGGAPNAGENRWNINKLEDLIATTKLQSDAKLTSPTLLKRAQLTLFEHDGLVHNREEFSHENTPETVDSISEKQLVREYSAEELHQEMANLEGLMKDLNQITQHQFDC